VNCDRKRALFVIDTWWGSKRALGVEKWMKTVGNCCGKMGMCSVDEKHAITIENESRQSKMAENACRWLRMRVVDQDRC
jgi:hypothetical protein